jgi:hypothetical protein
MRHAVTWLICPFKFAALSNCYLTMGAAIRERGALYWCVINVIQHWSITEWSDTDHRRHDLRHRDSGNMGFWEARALLCAVRLWLPAAPPVGPGWF